MEVLVFALYVLFKQIEKPYNRKRQHIEGPAVACNHNQPRAGKYNPRHQKRVGKHAHKLPCVFGHGRHGVYAVRRKHYNNRQYRAKRGANQIRQNPFHNKSVCFPQLPLVFFEFSGIAVYHVSLAYFPHNGLILGIIVLGNRVVNNALSALLKIRVGQGYCGKQRFCVRVQRVRKQLVAVGKLHHFPVIHYAYFIGKILHNR